jgi:hypothetical protein
LRTASKIPSVIPDAVICIQLNNYNLLLHDVGQVPFNSSW